MGIIVSNIIKRSKKFEIIGFIDNDKRKKSKRVNKLPILGNDTKLIKYSNKKINLVITIGDINKRIFLFKKFKRLGFIFPKIVDTSCNIEKNVRIGKGTIIANSSVVLNNVKIGKFCIIGSGVKILHHVKISDNVIIGGGTTVGSNVSLGKNIFVGVGSVFASKKLTVGDSCYVCSGSVILKSIQKNQKVIGNPAVSIPFKKNENWFIQQNFKKV